MPRAHVRDIEIEYDLRGRATDPVLVLIMGFTMQLIHWDDRFCDRIAHEGFRVLRFDNRDAGRSTHLTALGLPDLGAVLGGNFASVRYSLGDMADNVVGLLDALDVRAAHLVGASMGGMIAQAVAIKHPTRVRSLCSIMSTTGDRAVGTATPEALAVLLTPPPSVREANIERGVEILRIIGSPGYPLDEARARARGGAAFDRGYDPPGGARQFAAIVSAPDRTQDLAHVTVPTVVVHGAADPLITPTGGEATARAIPGAVYELIPGMGHDLPEGVWDRVTGAIVANARRASPQ